MLVIGRTVRGDLEPHNCTVLDLPDGTRCRLWLVPGPRRDGVRVVIDAPRAVWVRRGEHLGNEAEGGAR